ncbi:MAG: hypothetical protein OCU12_04435 [Methanophagales archaeon]|nr:hypothetical protein [Methanophagales archaeon]
MHLTTRVVVQRRTDGRGQCSELRLHCLVLPGEVVTRTLQL